MPYINHHIIVESFMVSLFNVNDSEIFIRVYEELTTTPTQTDFTTLTFECRKVWGQLGTRPKTQNLDRENAQRIAFYLFPELEGKGEELSSVWEYRVPMATALPVLVSCKLLNSSSL